MSLLIRMDSINKTENYIIYRSDFSDIEDTDITEIGKLFRELQKSYGRCTSKVYRDIDRQTTIEVGYVFEKKRKYARSKEYYIEETWIEIMERIEVKTITTKKYLGYDKPIIAETKQL